MHLTAVNAKTEVEPELASEMVRKFDGQPTEAIREVFREWRDHSRYFPAISDLNQLFTAWHRRREMKVEKQNQIAERDAEEKARREGELLAYHEVLRQLAEVAKRMPESPTEKRWRKFEEQSLSRPFASPAIVLTKEELMELSQKQIARKHEFALEAERYYERTTEYWKRRNQAYGVEESEPSL
jgi:hypothetical protein